MVLDDYGFFDYSAEASGIYEYTSDEYTQVVKSLVGNGVVNSLGSKFATTANGLVLSVGTGVCYVNGRYGNNKSIKTLTLAAAQTGVTRTDRLILRAEKVNRTVSLEVLRGTTGVPALTQTEEIYEIPLYRCDVSGSAVALTDQRNLVYTPTEVMEKMQRITSGTEYVYAVYA